jgi:hypothetical protein
LRFHQQARSIQGPVHDLTFIQAQVSAGNFHAFAGSAIDKVVTVFGCSRRAARTIIQQIVCGLTVMDYARSIQLQNGVRADEYGRMFHDYGWYIKLVINADDGECEVWSCHLTRHALRTRAQTIRAFDREQE